MSMQNGDICKFAKADQNWDTKRLFKDLETKQLKKPTPSEQRNLRAILLGLSPKDASLLLGLDKTSLKSAFSNLYRLIEELVNHPEKSINHRNAPLVLAKYHKSETLLGRDDNLVELQELRNKYKIVLLKSDAGMGKSELARHFMENHFPKLIKINMGLSSSEVTPAKEKLSIILSELGKETSQYFETNLEALRNILSDRANPIGVLIDNLEPALDKNFRFQDSNYDSLLRVLCDRDVCSFTLITSRISPSIQAINHQQFFEYKLKGLDLAAWQEYFRDCKNAKNFEALVEMRNFYEGKPEAMARLQGIISDRDNFDGDIEAYWKKYKYTSLADPDLKHLTSVQIDDLQYHQPDVYKLLCRMGCYRYQTVPTAPHEGLLCLMWDVAESRHNEIIERLKKYSLIKLNKGEYSLHSATREVVKKRLEEDILNWESTNRSAAKFWTDSIKSVKNIDDAVKAFEAYYHYLVVEDYQSACEILLNERDDPSEDKQILGRTLLKMGLLQQIKEATINVINKVNNNTTSLFKLHRLLGSIFSLTGEIQSAIEQHELSKKLSYQLEDCGLTAFLNIGICQLTIFDIESAKQNFETTLDLLEKTRYRENLKIDVSCFLAYVHSIIGCQSQVISFANQAEKLEEKIQYFYSATFGASYYFLGKAYTNIRLLEKSFETYDKATSFAEATNCYTVIGASLTGQAELYRLQIDFSKALDYHEKSIKIIKPTGAISILADAYLEYALTYQAMGEHDQAKIYKMEAIKLFKQMEAPKQIERAIKAFD